MKDIFSGSQSRVLRQPVFRRRRDPILIQPFHFVGVQVFFRRGIVERSELEGKDIVAMVKFDGLDLGKGPGEMDFAVHLAERGEHDGRDVGIVLDRLWIKSIKAVDAAEEHLAACALEEGTAVELVALQAVTIVIIFTQAGDRIKAHQSVVGADPEVSLFILQNAVHRIARQPLPGAEGSKGAVVAIETEQTRAPGSQPKEALPVFVHTENIIAADAVRVLRIVAKMGKASRRGVVAIQAAALRSDPVKPCAVFENETDIVAAEGV